MPDAIPRERSAIVPGVPRTQVQARLSDGRIFEAPPGTRLAEVLDVACEGRVPAVAATVDGHLTELDAPLAHDAAIRPICLNDDDGTRIYRRSLILLLSTAVGELFPGASIAVKHAATTAGAYFCRVHGRVPFTLSELEAITRRMNEIVAEDSRITKVPVSIDEAVRLFEERGQDDTARLLRHRTKNSLHLYDLRGNRQYFQGFMVPSTGLLRWFALHSFPPGFMLQFPHRDRPADLDRIVPYPKLFSVFEEYGEWLDRLGVRNVGSLNDGIVANLLPEISLVGEALHEARIARIASDIAARRGAVRVVLVAGPSSSGKTTFSKRLAIQLVTNGIRPFPLALDDYFLERDETPRDEKGEYDYESLRALDVPLFNGQLNAMMRSEPVQLPRYNFKTGMREDGSRVTLGGDHVIIVEGIHGLNPDLVPGLPPERIYRVYISALTQLNLDAHNRVSTSDTRMIRRLVRDAATRGYEADATLRRWPSVVAGEKKHIFPYQENGDAVFNSALVHELAVLRPLAEPLLLQVQPESAEWLESRRLLSFLRWFRPATPEVVPDNSILREFLGGSVLDRFDFTPRIR
jgi:uridine kinase